MHFQHQPGHADQHAGQADKRFDKVDAGVSATASAATCDSGVSLASLSASAPHARRLFSASERFNGRISDPVDQTRFASAADLDDTLNQYMTTWNNHIP